MADPGEAFGKDVDEPAPDELVRMERHDVGLAGGAGGPTQQDVSPGIISNEPLGGECAAPDVAGKVTQGGATTAGVLELDIPYLRWC